MIFKCGIGDTGNEARYFKKVVDFSEIGIGKGMSRKPLEYTAGCQGARAQNSLGDLARGHVVAEEDNSLLREQAIRQDNDRMCRRAICCEVCVWWKWLW